MSDKRKAFNFDLDNEKLEEFYPSPSGSKTSYNNAWSKIQKFMETTGFVHRQYSGYESVHGMSYAEAYNVLERLQDTFPWFGKCVKVATLTEIGKRYDVLEYLERYRENAEHADSSEPPEPERHVSLCSETKAMKRASKALEDDGKNEYAVHLKPTLDTDVR
ncbi:hypothetical protein GIR35_12355 [Enterococcus faecalis]|nr:hypothetical protein GIR35_12355 [Enterococcus faecalis]